MSARADLSATAELLALTCDWTWETDAEHRYTDIGEDCSALTGIKRSGIIGHSRLATLDRDAASAEAAASHRQTLAARRPFRDFLQRVPAPGASCRWVSLSGMPKRDAGGAFAGYRGTARDVTKLIETVAPSAAAVAEPVPEAGRTNAERLMAALNVMQDAFVYYDAEDRIVLYNDALFTLYRGMEDVIRPGLPVGEFIDTGLERGIWSTDGLDAAAWREAYFERRAREPDAAVTLRLSDGRWLMHRELPTADGGRMGVCTDITPLKQREAELAEALERSQLADAAINSVEDAVFVKDCQLRFVFANEAFARLNGTTVAAILGKRAADIVAPADAVRFEDSERAVLASGEAYEIEEDFDHAGVARSHLVRKTRLETATGTAYVAGFVFDISDIRRREREADEARTLLARVIETLPAGVIIYDKQDRLVLSNQRIKDLLPALRPFTEPGQTLRVAIETAHDAGYFRHSGDPELDALFDADREAWIERTLERYHVRQSVSERRNPDGRWLRVYDTRTEDGLFVGVRVDITDMKQREASLQETTRENELFRTLIDNVPVAIYAKHPDLRIAYVNQGWCDLTGFAKDTAIGRTDVEVFGADGEAYMEADRAVLKTGEMRVIEETGTDADGAPNYRIARKSTMIASDGSLYLIGSTTDVTELKQREEELRAAEQRAVLADRAKSEFLANMSHEIRTPMNGVLGMAELLAKSDLDQKQKTFTEIILKSGNALLTIINDILDFSKIDAGQLVLDPVPFNLAEAVEDVATLMSTRAKEKDLELVVRVDPDLPRMVTGDVGRLRQILTNLVGNAVKFTDSGHVLADVSGAVDAGRVSLRFEITDTGIGIASEKLPTVFEKFSQADTSATRRHEGTGLGLAITARLVALMGGKIGAESTVGKGSTFWFTVELPVAEEGARDNPVAVDVSGARVLVVDDNQVNRAILLEQMRSWDFDACAAENGGEGLAVLQAAAALGLEVECVVLDYQMPGMSGLEVAGAIRNTAGLAGTAIVLLTSVDHALTSAEFAEYGIDAQLTKPVRSCALLDVVVEQIQHRRGRLGGLPATDSAPAEDPDKSATPAVSGFSQDSSQSNAVVGPSGGNVSHDDGAQARPPRRAARLDILVAEDNEVNQLVFAQILGETPFTYEIVRNGRLAVEAHAEMQPAMILMDVSMPDMNGFEATEAIRRVEAGRGVHTPIIGVTAHALKGDRARCTAAGMDDYLPKPISPNALLAKVYKWHETAAPRRDQGV
ncbi:PAS domain-containing hybrid sensor histidine kinase/response regulator [Nitratireductor alexandrii]|uniref:PAS domain-containing hybrid sensor histidine kinase/response regulator n=1 Tax=Nitratireductor alexandrii TaxID=2448161 RepID=UPI001EE7FA8D|nr:response regulator [Nitratireductor alexandrii]